MTDTTCKKSSSDKCEKSRSRSSSGKKCKKERRRRKCEPKPGFTKLTEENIGKKTCRSSPPITTFSNLDSVTEVPQLRSYFTFSPDSIRGPEGPEGPIGPAGGEPHKIVSDAHLDVQSVANVEIQESWTTGILGGDPPEGSILRYWKDSTRSEWVWVNPSNNLALGYGTRFPSDPDEATEHNVILGYRAGTYDDGLFPPTFYSTIQASRGVYIGADVLDAGSGGPDAIAIGTRAGTSTESKAISIGFESGANQNISSIALGTNSGFSQYIRDIALGYQAGETQLGDCIAIGSDSGKSQALYSIALGLNSGNLQAQHAIAIGAESGASQSEYDIAIGGESQELAVGGFNIAIGHLSGKSQTGGCIAIGLQAGKTSQGLASIALGEASGWVLGAESIAIGKDAGNVSGENNISIGSGSGWSQTANNSISIGYNSGSSITGVDCNAFGHRAGTSMTGTNNTAIGSYTGSSMSQSHNLEIGNRMPSHTTAFSTRQNVQIGAYNRPYSFTSNGTTGNIDGKNVLIGGNATESATSTTMNGNTVVVGIDILRDTPAIPREITAIGGNIGLTLTGVGEKSVFCGSNILGSSTSSSVAGSTMVGADVARECAGPIEITAVGASSGLAIGNEGTKSTLIGSYTGIKAGAKSTYLGYASGSSALNNTSAQQGDGCVIVSSGTDVGVSSVGDYNNIQITGNEAFSATGSGNILFRVYDDPLDVIANNQLSHSGDNCIIFNSGSKLGNVSTTGNIIINNAGPELGPDSIWTPAVDNTFHVRPIRDAGQAGDAFVAPVNFPDSSGSWKTLLYNVDTYEVACV